MLTLTIKISIICFWTILYVFCVFLCANFHMGLLEAGLLAYIGYKGTQKIIQALANSETILYDEDYNDENL